MDQESFRTLITAISTLSAAGIVAFFSYKTTQKKDELQKLNDQLRRVNKNYADACKQIAAYYQLELTYASDLAAMTSKAERQLRIDYRDKVVSAGYQRPSWTAKDAQDAISQIEEC